MVISNEGLVVILVVGLVAGWLGNSCKARVSVWRSAALLAKDASMSESAAPMTHAERRELVSGEGYANTARDWYAPTNAALTGNALNQASRPSINGRGPCNFCSGQQALLPESHSRPATSQRAS